MGKYVFVDEFSRASVHGVDMGDAARSGEGVIKDVASRIEMDGGAPLWVEGPNRAWLAAAISGSVGAQTGTHPLDEADLRMFLELGGTVPSWQAVAHFLAGRDDVPAVVTYSVCDAFPSPVFAPGGGTDEDEDVDDEEEDRRIEAFDALTRREQWSLCMPFLRDRRPDAELGPDLAFARPLRELDERLRAETTEWLAAIHPRLTAAEVQDLASAGPMRGTICVLTSSAPAELMRPPSELGDLEFARPRACRIQPLPADYRDTMRWTARGFLGASVDAHVCICDETNVDAILRTLLAHDPACVIGVSTSRNLAWAHLLHAELADRPILTAFAWQTTDRNGEMGFRSPEDEQLAELRPLTQEMIGTYAGEDTAEAYLAFLADQEAAIRRRRAKWEGRRAAQA